MFKKKSESGRSMVEMLGVLAIIGVLFIGGIAGYTLSMRRYRANQVADALNKYALIVYDSCQKVIIQGDITGLSCCTKLKPYPTYAESGLAQIGDLKNVSVNGIRRVWDANLTYEEIGFRPSFNDENICNATRSVTGWISNDQCSSEIPWYSFSIEFK